MAKISEWDVFWAKVAFEDEPEVIKMRPVVITSNRGAFIMSFYATSQSPKPGYDCYVLKQWKEAGLSKPTVIRLDKCLRLIPDDFGDYIGHLTEQEIFLIQFELARILNR